MSGDGCHCWWKSLLWWGVIPCLVWTLFTYCCRKMLAKHWGVANLDRHLDLRGKIAVVTGSTNGIGFETVVQLANRGATVVVTGRTLKSAKRAIIQMRNLTFLGTLVPLKLELSSLESVTKFCDAVQNKFETLDLLVNNAGVFMPVQKREKSMEGYEIHFAVNHLGPFLLTNLLLPLLKKTEKSRIVTLSSLNHCGSFINFDDLMYEKTEIKDHSMLKNCLYTQSKLANILFVQELRNRLKKSGFSKSIKTYVVCPGIVKTKITRNFSQPWFAELIQPLIDFMFKTPLQGAQTTLHCGLSEDIDDGNNCILYRHCKPWNPKKDRSYPEDFLITTTADTDYSQESARKLWTESEKLVGKTFDLT